jgi:hypothetical protein
MKPLLILFLLPVQLFAQDIAGIWTGVMQTTGSQLLYELVISENKDKLTGYSLTVFTFDGIENMGVKTMKLKNKKGTITIEDDELIYNNYSTPPKRVKLSGTLFLQVKDSIMILNGTFSTRTIDFRSTDQSSFKGTIRLQKKNNFSQTKLISKLGEMNLLNTLSFIQPKIKEKKNAIVSAPAKELPLSHVKQKEPAKTIQAIVADKTAADLAKRKTEIIRSVFFRSDSLVIKLYDNGEIDGDTVSVVLNGKVIIAKKELTATAITVTIFITPDLGDSLQLIMYAENLGRIPPNTGLLTLQDGDERYDIRFSEDFQKNSAIVLKRKR